MYLYDENGKFALDTTLFVSTISAIEGEEWRYGNHLNAYQVEGELLQTLRENLGEEAKV